jgi:hypothetical protein
MIARERDRDRKVLSYEDVIGYLFDRSDPFRRSDVCTR